MTQSKEAGLDLKEEDFTDSFEKDKQTRTNDNLIELQEQQNKKEKGKST